MVRRRFKSEQSWMDIAHRVMAKIQMVFTLGTDKLKHGKNWYTVSQFLIPVRDIFIMMSNYEIENDCVYFF
jgi:hypothetical protein